MYIAIYADICDYILLYMAIYFVKSVFWMSGLFSAPPKSCASVSQLPDASATTEKTHPGFFGVTISV